MTTALAPTPANDDPAPLAAAQGPLAAVLAWHLAVPGKGMRRRLAQGCARALGLDAETAAALGDVAEAAHEASILLDDVADAEGARRGRPSAAARFGPDLATLASLRLLAEAQARAAALAPREPRPGAAAEALARAVAAACEGQAADLAGRPDGWEAYDRAARRKTGRLVALAVELPACAAGLSDEAVAAAREAAERIGLAYQIRDDLEDGDLDPAAFEPPPAQRLERLRAEIARAIDAAPARLRGPLARLAREAAA